MWQPVGVVIASATAYGTAARWRCDIKLPSCKAVSAGEACCTPSSNMGWRYQCIVLGAMTLTIFFLRFFVFRFYESPKFLLSKGREAEAIEVLHKIAKFNKAPPPTLTIEDFAAIDREDGQSGATNTATAKHVVRNFINSLKHLKGLFNNKLQSLIFVLLAITYMVRRIMRFETLLTTGRVITGLSIWPVLTFRSFFSKTTFQREQALWLRPISNTSTSIFQVSSVLSLH